MGDPDAATAALENEEKSYLAKPDMELLEREERGEKKKEKENKEEPFVVIWKGTRKEKEGRRRRR